MQPTAPAKDESENPVAAAGEALEVSEPSDQRDIGVTDAIWDQLQAEKAYQELAQGLIDNSVVAAEEETRLAAEEAVVLAKEVEFLAARKAGDVKLQEIKRRERGSKTQRTSWSTCKRRG